MRNVNRRRMLGGMAGAVTVSQLAEDAQAALRVPDRAAVPLPGLDVRSFGAAGDGRTDDSRAIQSALNAMGGHGLRHLFFPPGQYCISRPLVVPRGLTSAEFQGASGYDGVRGPINYGLSTSLKWTGGESPEAALVRFDQSSGVRWSGISLDCSYKAGYGLQLMSSDAETGSAKNIIENCSIHYAVRDGILVGEWGTPTAPPGQRQFFGNVFRNLTFFGCRSAGIHVNEWNADQQLFDTVMVYFDDGPKSLPCHSAFWFDHGGQWSMLLNCQSGGMAVDPDIPSSGYMIRNQASDSTIGGAFGLTVINAWQEGAGGLYYGVTSTNDHKGLTFLHCSAFTSDTHNPSVFIDKGTFAPIRHSFISCTFASDIKLATPAIDDEEVALINCSFADGRGVIDAGGRRTINGVYRQGRVGDGVLIVPAGAETVFCTLTDAAREVVVAARPRVGARFTLIVEQDGAGHHGIAWQASRGFTARPSIPQPDPAPGASTSYSFVCDGSAYYLTSCVGGRIGP